ncbi:MAG: hypothetical protein KF864_07095 [Phycisphaeraceae bacterium]|nr:hypothetical protein [Phycisphaeraceae bacterium]
MSISTHTPRTSVLALALCASLAALTPPANADITWTFDNGDEGWLITDLQCYGPYGPVLQTFGPEWYPTGGNPGGFIQKFDPSYGCFFFSAPASAMGDWSQYAGGTLTYSMRSSRSNNDTDSVVVLTSTRGTSIVTRIDPMPRTTWTDYSIPLTAERFRHGLTSGAPVTEADLLDVLGSLAALRIPGEYGVGVVETVGLDSVSVTRGCDCACFDCAADFNQDGGIDGADVEAFYDAWETGACDADVNLDGGIDGGDVEYFFGLWEAGGCE